MVSSSKVGYRSRAQRSSLEHTVILGVDSWGPRLGLDGSLNLAVESQSLDAAWAGWDNFEAANKG